MPSRNAPRIEVYINGKLSPEWRPLRSERSCNSHRLDHCTLELDLGFTGGTLVDQRLAPNSDLEVEIVETTEDNSKRVTHWGKVAFEEIELGNTEKLRVVSRIDEFHLSQPLVGYWTWNPNVSGPQQVFEELIFNRAIDGVTFGNRHPNQGVQDAFGGVPLFLDPESARTKASQKFNNIDSLPTFWKLSEAVAYLCRVSNPKEFYVKNPAIADLAKIFDDQTDLLRHVHLPHGLYLSQALDRLIGPLGYSWYIALDERGRRFFAFFKRGEGTDQVQVYLQCPGELLDTDQTNVKQCQIKYDITEIANSVVGLGSFVEVEATFELLRCWSPSDDALANTPDLLRIGQPHFNEHVDVWRKWVLNEAGDYTGLRPEIKLPYDFSKLSAKSAFTVKRRKFLPCLTLGADGLTPIGRCGGCRVEYWNPNSDSGRWIESHHEVHVLEHECGVHFAGQLPPREIMLLGDKAKVRITATIQLDQRLLYHAQRRKDSPNADDVTVVLDLHDRFHFKRVDKSSQVTGSKTLAVDDTAALKTYCDQVRDTYNVAEVNGPVVIEGIDWLGYELGQSVTKIEGREIDFNGVADSSRQPLYPQIVGIALDYQSQTTTLTLQQFKAARLGAVQGLFFD